MSERLPMFPLGSVLVPHLLLPLRIFEPRYLDMFAGLAPGGEFGVVLIERGNEVGGGDARFDVGCVARIKEISQLEGGQLLVMAAGTERLRVIEWLVDDPYPQAIVERLVDEGPTETLHEEMARLQRLVDQSLGLMAELGYDIGPDQIVIVDDPIVAAYQGLMLAPLSTLDRQRLLEVEGASERLRRVLELIEDQNQLLSQQLSAG